METNLENIEALALLTAAAVSPYASEALWRLLRRTLAARLKSFVRLLLTIRPQISRPRGAR